MEAPPGFGIFVDGGAARGDHPGGRGPPGHASVETAVIDARVLNWGGARCAAHWTGSISRRDRWQDLAMYPGRDD
jgi:hypothetical protein